AAYCGYVLVIMSLYWITECLPIAVTSLLPVLLFPIFNILSSNATSQIYFQDIQMLFFGGLVLAIGIEKTGLHERVALKIIMFFGSDPKWLLLGVMTVTGFLSLWISNTASSSMMLPIVVALVKQLAKYNPAFSNKKTIPSVSYNKVNDASNLDTNTGFKVEHVTYNDDEGTFHEETSEEHIANEELQTPAGKKLMKGFCLGIAYSASVGGSGSLVGTTPNLLLKGFFDTNYPDGGLNFLTYLLFSLPAAAMVVLASWIVLAVIWLPKSELMFFKKKPKTAAGDQLKKMIKNRYDQLGPISFDQISVGILFVLCVLLWLTREPIVDGWHRFFGYDKYVSDTTPAILIVILSFVWPKNNIFQGHKYEHLLKWSDMINFPWDVILLGGGSLAIAKGFQESGLSTWIGDILKDVMPEQKGLALLIILLFCGFGTEFTSNTSMASIFIPIANSLASSIGIIPHYFLMPMTVCVSFAFLFPVATPPNAIVFGSGYIKIKDMIISGISLKIIGIAVLMMAANVWLYPIFPNATIATNTNVTESFKQVTFASNL
ncbi:solute carrier family 13 member 2, partial [Brachionus plicatilis]